MEGVTNISNFTISSLSYTLISIQQNLTRSMLIFLIFGNIGNLCNCFVFLCIPSLKKHPNALFVVASSIGSFIFVNIALWSTVINAFTKFNLANESLFWCKMYMWISYSSGCFSFMCNCFAALGQFLITSRKIKWQRLMTRMRARLMILFTAISWLFILIPLPIFYDHIQTPSTTISCTTSIQIIASYNTYCTIIGYYFLPIILIFILFFLN